MTQKITPVASARPTSTAGPIMGAPKVAPPVKVVKEGGEKVKRASRQRVAFDFSTAKNKDGKPIKLTEDGKLTEAPFNWTRDFQVIKKKSFATKSAAYEFKARLVDFTIEKLQMKKAMLLEKATEGDNVDPKVKMQRKMERMRKQMAELERQLLAEGIDINSIK